MTGLILSSSTRIHFIDSQLPKYLKVKAFAFNKTLDFVSTKPSVPCPEPSWPVLDFRIAVFKQNKSNIELSD